MIFDKWGINDLEDGRPGQVKCVEEFRRRVEAWNEAIEKGNFVFSIMMACRYGKSDVIRCLAVEAIRLCIAKCALVVHPTPELSVQFLEEGRLKKWMKRWQPVLGSRDVKRLKDFAEDSMCNGEWLGSIHIAALVPPGRRQFLREWIDHVKHETGLPPIIFIDETQSYTNNEWGSIAKLFQDEGCPIVVCTATPYRNDGDDVFGFHREEDASKRKVVDQFYFSQNPEDDKTLIKRTMTKAKREFKVSADVEVGFQQAWSEGVIAKVTTLPIEFNCEGWGSKDGQVAKLSELSETDARRIIPTLVRDNSFIAEAVSKMIDQLDEFKRAGVERPAAIIFGMNDNGSLSNEHQEQIRKEIARQSDLECVIATMATDQATDEKSANKIADFCCPAKKKGDVLLLKQMGSSGLDIDRCCVVVLLGANRSQGQVIQQAMRGGNTTATKSHFVIIYPNEVIMQSILGDWIAENGGIFIKEELVDVKTEVVPKRDEKDKGGFIPSEKTDSGAGDHEGSNIPFDDVILVKYWLTELPILKLHYTYPQLAKKFKSMGVGPVPQEFINQNRDLVETTAICDEMRGVLFELVKKISIEEFKKKFSREFNGGNQSDRAELGKLKAQSANRIKARSGVSGVWDADSVRRSENICEYKKWVAAGREILREYNP